MQDSLSYVILTLMGVIIYLLVAQRKNKEEFKDSSDAAGHREALGLGFVHAGSYVAALVDL